MILPLKSQGYPGVLDFLGVQQPFTGPFWGFSPIVTPTFEIGSGSIQASCDPPTDKLWSEGIITTPLGPQSLAFSTVFELNPGWYFIHFSAWWRNTTNAVSLLEFQVRNALPTIFESTYIAMIDTSGGPNASGTLDKRMVARIPELGAQFAVNNVVGLSTAGSQVYCQMRTKFLGSFSLL